MESDSYSYAQLYNVNPEPLQQSSMVADQDFNQLILDLFNDDTPMMSSESNPAQPETQQRLELPAAPVSEMRRQEVELQRLESAFVQPIFEAPDQSGSAMTACQSPADVPSVQAKVQPQPLFREEPDSVSEKKEQPLPKSPIEPSSAIRDVKAEVQYMKECLARYDKIVKENKSNGKIQVHQVVIFILLSTEHPSEMRHWLDNILVFCDAKGKQSNRRTEHFWAKDTKTMGAVWQQVKENRRATYDTFARAMRVSREKGRNHFEYLETGKGSKKRIYKLGEKCKEDMERMENMLSKIC